MCSWYKDGPRDISSLTVPYFSCTYEAIIFMLEGTGFSDENSSELSLLGASAWVSLFHQLLYVPADAFCGPSLVEIPSLMMYGAKSKVQRFATAPRVSAMDEHTSFMGVLPWLLASAR
eukprot:CAMPEP_0173302070 /NCGR_PEP_ID=MMETSP1143-20121109/18142_1 /TAXON_ID=483371 /ORGANISM="non described non described, Strain CCMP2298" /LENGTH=117 /DNA_ID=CAMNT_0014242653 /DNA_START=528 /DNA_END=881 /DNA_ORIENTATION=-